MVKAAFKVDETGRKLELSQLSAWVAKFNAVPENGKACLRTDPTDGQLNEFKSLTIVFDAAVKTFMSCSIRVLDIDAAHFEVSFVHLSVHLSVHPPVHDFLFA